MYRRAQIREAVATLVTGLATTGANVRVGPVQPDQLLELPALVVRTGDDDFNDPHVAWAIGGDNPQERRLELLIEARVEGPDLEGQIDQIHLEVEQVMSADPTLAGLVDRVFPASSPAPTSSGVLERPAGLRTLRYLADYRVDTTDPT